MKNTYNNGNINSGQENGRKQRAATTATAGKN